MEIAPKGEIYEASHAQLSGNTFTNFSLLLHGSKMVK